MIKYIYILKKESTKELGLISTINGYLWIKRKITRISQILRSYSYVPEMHKEEKKRDFPLDYDEQQII